MLMNSVEVFMMTKLTALIGRDCQGILWLLVKSLTFLTNCIDRTGLPWDTVATGQVSNLPRRREGGVGSNLLWNERGVGASSQRQNEHGSSISLKGQTVHGDCNVDVFIWYLGYSFAQPSTLSIVASSTTRYGGTPY